jgi:endonuclease/exonuclease/phosphatase family metal-dependent hydrolase
LQRRLDSHLDGGAEVVTRDGRTHRIVRGLLQAETEALGLPLRIGVTHLDHMAEVQRTIQAKHVLHELRISPRSSSSSSGVAGDDAPQTLLLGDLNALTAADYTTRQWAAHQDYNAA